MSNFHEQQAQIARDLYIKGMTAASMLTDWRDAKAIAQQRVSAALTATANLTDIPTALTASAEHLAALRRLLAPPASQDQFALLCPTYKKSKENRGSALSAAEAAAIAKVIEEWRDKDLTPWLDAKRSANATEVEALAVALTPLYALQIVGTVRRNRLSAQQEGEVILLLRKLGWTQRAIPLVSQSQLGAKEFAHKTRFETKTRPQEVDVACGLKKGVVLAMECKVTNDHTNSIKRINDILKKAQAWKEHWGSFVQTAALLQGVIKPKDVKRLLDADVEVFWSHRLSDFESWLGARV